MTAIPMFEIEFTKEGRLFDTRQTDAVVDALPQFSDLIVFSHGWNNDMADARALSHDFLQKVEEVFDEGIVPEVQGRTFSAIIVLWPSKKFTDEELIPGGGASLNEDLRPVERILEELKNDPNRLGQQDVSEVRKKLVDQAKALLPQLKVDAAARRDYVFLLRALVSPTEAHADDGSLEFFTRKPEEIFNAMSAAVAAPIGPGAGGTTSLGGGGAAGLKDIVDGIVGAARRLANFATYYQMKERAGLVGRTGLNQVLRRLRKQKPALRLHLIGHSFGARLVTAAADALDANTGAVTLALVQGAYSHNGLAQKFDGQNDGFFRKLITEKRVSGPIIITHTKNDWLSGSSRISNTMTAAFGDENDPYGGLGRNGAQRTPEAKRLAQALADLTDEQPGPYNFVAGKIYNLKADQFIKGHSDIGKHQVAYAVLKAAGQV